MCACGPIPIRPLVRACVRVCGGMERVMFQVEDSRSPEVQCSGEGDLREWVPLGVFQCPLLIGPLTELSLVCNSNRSRATCFFTSWVFRGTTPDAPELKYCCAKSIFTSRGMTSKNKPYPTCYPLLGSLNVVKSQPTDQAFDHGFKWGVQISLFLPLACCLILLTIAILFFYFAVNIHLQIRVKPKFRLGLKSLSLRVRNILKAVSYPWIIRWVSSWNHYKPHSSWLQAKAGNPGFNNFLSRSWLESHWWLGSAVCLCKR